MAPLEAVLVTHTIDLGGTEKSLLNHALAFDRTRVRPRAVALSEPGRRAPDLEAAGIPVAHASLSPERLVACLRGADVVHVWRGGLSDPMLPAACREAGVRRLVETNVFGLVDTSPDERDFACHLFMSQMCAIRYRR